MGYILQTTNIDDSYISRNVWQRNLSRARLPSRVIRRNWTDTSVQDIVNDELETRRYSGIVERPECDRDGAVIRV